MTERHTPKENYLLIVVSVGLVLGMAVAVGVYFAWRSAVIAPGFHNGLSLLALAVCPPFILSTAIGPSPDSGFALTLAVGTIVFANAFLYAGVAAGGYFVFGVLRKKQRSAPS